MNMPQGDIISCYYPAPTVQKRLKMQIVPRKGETLKAAFAAVPQKTSAMKMEVVNNSVILPDLTDTMILVLRYQQSNAGR